MMRATWCFRLPAPHARYLRLRYSDDTAEAVRAFLHRPPIENDNHEGEVKIEGGHSERLHIKLQPEDAAVLDLLRAKQRAKTWIEALRADIEADALRSGVVLEPTAKGIF